MAHILLCGGENVRDLEKEGKKLLEGTKGEKLRGIAASEEARRLEQQLDHAAVERAVRSGDADQIGALLRQVLSTEEGKSLAQKLSRL